MPKICHVVLWKLKEGITVQSAQSSFGQLRNLKAPGRLAITISPTVGPAERTQGYDIGMYSTFESMDALNTYTVSQEHVDCVNNHVKPHTIAALAYDWEIPE